MNKLIAALFLTCLVSPAFAATCAVSEYISMVEDVEQNAVPVPSEPRLVSNPVTYTTSTGSNAFNASTRFIGFKCDAKAHYRVSLASAGTNATATDLWVNADELLFIGVPAGGLYLIEFYDGTS